ncbi:MAG: hypothetical protein F4020_01765 [Gammaproteobacteria bacterium]|nr:hypothetical protein [Gammaproteobacteria bacterium]MYC52667.1 hypothetical protein [Gammaproteobacteria bacterium]MYK68322.1 hypothetical protein [Gammaproteobacteria bacterium]
MDKNFAIGTVAVAVALLVLGYVEGAVGVGEAATLDLAGILGLLFAGAFYTLVLGWRGVGNAQDGFKGGAVLGAVMSLMGNGIMSGDAVMALVVAAVVTGIVGAVLGVLAARGDSG